ncbi:hypothetical protein LIER_43398 [Lithospermum erythrorhizon]|uniref:Uncharacterized protein n=1 Tax=Lithospermum erythrorhizon TaxID=34254 RepID=A0AAV3PZJ3_LITER
MTDLSLNVLLYRLRGCVWFNGIGNLVKVVFLQLGLGSVRIQLYLLLRAYKVRQCDPTRYLAGQVGLLPDEEDFI